MGLKTRGMQIRYSMSYSIFPSRDLDPFGSKGFVELSEIPYTVRSWIQINKKSLGATHISISPSVGVPPSEDIPGHLYWKIKGFKEEKEIWSEIIIGILPEI